MAPRSSFRIAASAGNSPLASRVALPGSGRSKANPMRELSSHSSRSSAPAGTVAANRV